MSSGQIVTFPTGTLGVDKTGAPISQAAATQLQALGYRFALRSIGVPTSPTSQGGMLTASEIQGLWAANMAVSVFQLNFLQTTISSAQGTADGQYLAEQAQSLGLPSSAAAAFTLWFDLEGPMNGASASALTDYLNSWGSAVNKAGYGAGLYVGNNSALTTTTISDLPAFHAYWQAGQLLYTGMPARGYQMYQLYPADLTIAGIGVDVDVLQSDFQNARTPFWGPASSSAA